MKSASANFAFLVVHDRLLDQLGALAERYFVEDPSTSLLKLRQFGEVLAQRTAAQAGLYTSTEENQVELLGLAFTRLRSDGHIVEGLRSAINSAIRRGEVIRHNATHISRAQRNDHEATGQLSLALPAGASRGHGGAANERNRA